MEHIWLLALALNFQTLSCFKVFPEDVSKSISLSDAFSSLIEDEAFEHLDFIVCSKVDRKNQDLLNQILSKHSKQTFSVLDMTFLNITAKKRRKISNCIVICESYSQLSVFGRKIFNDELFTVGAFFIFLVSNISHSELDSFFHEMWSKQVSSIVVLTKSSEVLQTFTFTPFKRGKCRDWSPKVFNNFVNGSWTRPTTLFPEKFSNLKGCGIKINAIDNSPIVIKTILPNGTVSLDGIEVAIVRELGRLLNFRADIESNETDFGMVFEENLTFTGNGRHIMKGGDSDLILGNYYSLDLRNKYASCTQAYRYDVTKVVGSITEVAYTPFENLIRPFNVWIFVALFAILTAGCISIISLRKRKNFDESLNSTLNLFIVFLGGSQTKLPRKTFLRFLFVAFAFFCLVLRTLYQASLFSIMQSDGMKKGISTIEEMVDRNFSFFVSATLSQETQGMIFYSR